MFFGGRLVEVVFYEWPFYHEYLHLIPAYWLGGMATYGILLGGLIGACICPYSWEIVLKRHRYAY